MTTVASPEVAIRTLASAQDLLFTDAQAGEVGVSRRGAQHRVVVGRWQRVLPGVLAESGTELTQARLARAAVLSMSGADVLACRESAAAVWGLDLPPSAKPHVLVVGSRRTSKAINVHYTPALAGYDRAVVDGVAVTAVDRTLLDAALDVPEEALRLALDDAVRREIVSLARLRWRLRQPSRGKRGASLLRAMVQDLIRHGVPASPSERLLREIIGTVGLPHPVYNYVIKDKGRFIAQVDGAYVDLKIAIESDGYLPHAKRDVFYRDRPRQNNIVLGRWIILRYSWKDLVGDPDRVAGEIMRAIAQRKLGIVPLT